MHIKDLRTQVTKKHRLLGIYDFIVRCGAS
jgi:hypothetical protein